MTAPLPALIALRIYDALTARFDDDHDDAYCALHDLLATQGRFMTPSDLDDLRIACRNLDMLHDDARYRDLLGEFALER